MPETKSSHITRNLQAGVVVSPDFCLHLTDVVQVAEVMREARAWRARPSAKDQQYYVNNIARLCGFLEAVVGQAQGCLGPLQSCLSACFAVLSVRRPSWRECPSCSQLHTLLITAMTSCLPHCLLDTWLVVSMEQVLTEHARPNCACGISFDDVNVDTMIVWEGDGGLTNVLNSIQEDVTAGRGFARLDGALEYAISFVDALARYS